MTISSATGARAAAFLFLGGLLALALPATAWAHGGRIQPPPPDAKPGGEGPRVPLDTPPEVIGRPPTTPSQPGDDDQGGTAPPTTPGDDAGGPQRPVTGRPTGADRRRSGAGSGAFASSWEMWWELNRWNYFPERGFTWAVPGGVVTPVAPAEAKPDERALASKRRALVRREHIVPFLLGLLDPASAQRDEVRAAALIALPKLTHDKAAVALLFRFAEAPRASALVRESAALAVGMVRREHAAPLDGGALDDIRTRLLAIADDGDAPDRTRAFAALAIGLLGDQPFGDPFTKDGRVISRALWERATRKHASQELPVALLTALGMQPRDGTAGALRRDLQRVVHGRRIGRRSWSARERSHALAALVRLKGEAWTLALARVLTDRRVDAQVRRAAFIALGAHAEALEPAQREEAAQAADRALRLARDGLTRGLGLLAVGRLLAADLRQGPSRLLERSGAGAGLLGAARHGPLAERGFAVLGVGLALRSARSRDARVGRFKADALAALRQGFERTREARARSAYVVALGLAGRDAREATDELTGLLADRAADPDLRGHAALALAQMGAVTDGVRKSLRAALWDRRSVGLRSQAALALSFLGGRAETRMLIGELRKARSQWVLAQVAAALGQLGDVRAVPAILELAGDPARQQEARALAIASLGLLGDPEARPSMLRLTSDANYPARTRSLHEAYSIL